MVILIMMSCAGPNPTSSSAQTQKPLLSFDPSTYRATQANETFALNLTVENVENLWGWTTAVTWDSTCLASAGSPIEDDFLRRGGSTLFVAAPATNGSIPEITGGIFSAAGVTGSGVLARLAFKVTKECVDSPILMVNTTLLTPESDPSTPSGHREIVHQTNNAIVTLILGEKPVANAGSPQTVDQGVQVTFNGSKTVPAEGLKFVWNFVDKGPKVLEEMIAYYTFEVPGTYDIILTVENSKGDRSNATVQIFVRDITPPVAKIVVEGLHLGQSVAVDQSLTFDASESYDPDGGDIAKYLWSFGDESETNPTAETVTHEYARPGSFLVTLTVFDQRGNNSASETLEITVGTEYSQAMKLPPVIIGILVVVTALVIAGSAFWLRSRKTLNRELG